MRRWIAGCIDNATGYEIILSECSLNEAGFELEVMMRGEPMDVTWKNQVAKIIYPKGIFYYDESREMLLLKEKNRKENIMEEIARKLFVTLNKEKYIYYVLNDQNFVDKFYAKNDEEAIKIFEERKWV